MLEKAIHVLKISFSDHCSERKRSKMASAAIDLLIGRLMTFVEDEVTLMGAARAEVVNIKDELETMKSFFMDVENKGAQGEVEKTWIAKVRDISNDVEDIIDEFTYHTNKKQSWNKLKQILHLLESLWERYLVAKKLQQINVKIKEVPERSQRYRVLDDQKRMNLETNWIKNYAESSLFLKDDDLVGLSDAKQEITEWLLGEESQRTVLSIVGMGGSGKTTLAANIFNSHPVKLHFECCAWVTVSQNYTVEDLLRTMVKEFYGATKKEIPFDLNNFSYRELVEKLIEYLQPKRYVAVLDDVWNINLWKEINVALPNSLQGSRVMLTTRIEDIASISFGVGSHVYSIRPLDGDLAWRLFCMKAFSRIPEASCPAELKSIANDLVQKCGGLPLGIVTLGAVMATKILEKSEWGRVHKSLSWELRTNPVLEVVKSILLLSFKDLPYQLKHCFLYCCIFPENYVIQRSRLVRLWIAEGFVEQVKGHSLEETAEVYLMQLINRSMLQVVQRHSNGRPKACKLHDLLREVAISISEEEKFCTIVTEQEVAKESRVHRLSLQAFNGEISNKDLSKVRTFFVFLPKVITSSFISLPSGFKMLTVMDFKNVPIVELPEYVDYCFNLKYLNLKGTKLKELPRSIGKLRGLQTLDIRNTGIKELHWRIAKLKSLRHLLMYRFHAKGNLKFEYVSGTRAPLDACELKNLQVLDCLEVESEVSLTGLKHTTQLTRLGLTKVREACGTDLCSSIERMKFLRYLFVMAIDEDEVLRMDALSSPPPFLDTLWLIGKLEKLPNWFHSLHSITRIHLHWSRLTEDFLPFLQALPNLARLYLINAYSGTNLHFQSGFQKLSYLALRLLPQLTEITFEKGVMPCIQELDIESCVELKTLPSGIEDLPSLQELSLWSMPTEFLRRLREEGARDRNKVHHILKIGHYSETESGSWTYESLS